MRSFHLPGRSTVHSMNGMCAASHPLAAFHALEVLRNGGNAVDAAVTASAILCVVEPQMTGIGGDCFALIAKPDGSITGLDASGRAPRAADEDWLRASGLEEISPDGVHAVTVPGAVDGWDRLLSAQGTIDLATAVAPAIALAEDGVPVAPRVAWDWALNVDKLARDEGGAEHYLVNGRAPRAGEVHAVPALAATLRRIGEEGARAFYEGEIAEEMVACLRARGGLLDLEDLSSTQASWVDPIASSYGDFDVLEMPPAGQGVTALVLLNILKHFDLKSMDPAGPERFHIEIEAARLAYEVRDRYIADPAMVDVPLEKLLSGELADHLAARIDVNRRIEDIPAAVDRHHSDTVYLTVVDKDRTAVSFINSIFKSFGSGIVTPKSGIILHNRGAGFVAQPGHPNCIAPAKRPLHTIIPAMLAREGRAVMPFGVMGGAYQAVGHAHLVTNIVDYGMDLQEGLDFPRAFYVDERLAIEEGLSAETVAGLSARGHHVFVQDEPLGGGQAIWIDQQAGTLTGGSDPRKDGLALGY